MLFLSLTEAKIDWNWQWERSKAEEDIVEAENERKAWMKPHLRCFSMKTLICKALPEVWREERRHSGFATETCFGCLHWDTRPIKSPSRLDVEMFPHWFLLSRHLKETLQLITVRSKPVKNDGINKTQGSGGGWCGRLAQQTSLWQKNRKKGKKGRKETPSPFPLN